MPAYRSSAEGEIRDAVVAHIRAQRPGARIIHEINANSFGSRIDVLSVDLAEIVAVEIKSAKDKLDRLPAQMTAMRGVAHHAFVALHEKFLVEAVTNPHAAHSERDGVFYRRSLPDSVDYARGWVFPQRRRAMLPEGWDSIEKWNFPSLRQEQALPSGALGLLWRDELYDLCGQMRISVPRRVDMATMLAALRWQCTGAELTRGICRALRARICVEADKAVVCAEVKA